MATRALSWLAVVTAACAQESPAPAQMDEALDEGELLALPVNGEFPRLGIQWTYRVEQAGFGDAGDFPPRVAYRLTAKNDMGHPWAGWWMYGQGRKSAFTGATITPYEVYFHPPRKFGFRVLEWAPWPVAAPGTPGRVESVLRLGKGWGEHEGKEVEKVRNDIGPREVSVPAGRFPDAWYVEGASPGWAGRFWWVDRVGWAKMEFAADDGRRIVLDLLAVRSVDARR